MNKKMYSSLRLLYLAGLFILSSFMTSYSQSFEAEGTLIYQVHPRQDGEDESNLPEPFIRDFTVFVEGDEWLIRIDGHIDAILYFETGYDGEYLFNYLARRQGGEVEVANPAGTGTIWPGPALGENEALDFAHYIWLALASHDYFAGLEPGDPIKPMWRTQSEVVPADFELSDKAPFLPEKIVYWRLPPNGDGSPAMRARFEKTREEELGSLELPTEWEFVRYAPNEVRVSVKGAVHRLAEPAPQFSSKPKILGHIAVDDYRYREFDPPVDLVQYIVTDNQWPAIDADPAYSRYQGAARVIATTDSDRTLRMWIVVAGAVLFGAAPILVIFILQRRG